MVRIGEKYQETKAMLESGILTGRIRPESFYQDKPHACYFCCQRIEEPYALALKVEERWGTSTFYSHLSCWKKIVSQKIN